MVDTIQNNSTLEERLGALLEPEVLSEDNQLVLPKPDFRNILISLRYLCPRCDSLQDAERHMEISSLPPVLHFSLLRFVYDLSTMERKKSKHNISYPTVIDMDRYLGPPDAVPHKRRKKGDLHGKNVYQLRGILLHKGASAYHGHYEAQVFDVQCVNDKLLPCWHCLTLPKDAVMVSVQRRDSYQDRLPWRYR